MEFQSNKELSKYVNELEEDVKLSVNNLREKALMASSIWAKWLAYLYKEKENLSRLSEIKQKILKQKLKDNKNSDSVLRIKSEEKISENDENIRKINLLSKITQTNIDYIERALNVLQNFGFNIKNITDIIKLNLK